MKEFKNGIMIFLFFSLLTGLLYPLFITGISQIFFPNKANGSLIYDNKRIIGSELIGQSFTDNKYFHSRPSAINYDANTSGGTNIATTNPKLSEDVQKRVEEVKKINNLSKNVLIPADIVLSSSSGLDPHISLESALIQIPRISKVRNINEKTLKKLVESYTYQPFFGIFGKPVVNVLNLNINLDKTSGK